MLAWTIYISFLGAAALVLAPKVNARAARLIALLTAVAGFAISVVEVFRYTPGTLVTVTRAAWIPSLGIEYHLAADGISLTLLLLTGLVAIAGVLFSWNVERRPREFFALYLVLIGAVYGVFLSLTSFCFLFSMSLRLFPSIF